jgi:hypothetical protein
MIASALDGLPRLSYSRHTCQTIARDIKKPTKGSNCEGDYGYGFPAGKFHRKY